MAAHAFEKIGSLSFRISGGASGGFVRIWSGEQTFRITQYLPKIHGSLRGGGEFWAYRGLHSIA